MKFFALLLFATLAFPAFSQTCYVDMVDRFNRTVATYTGFGDPSCMEGMKQCRKAIRFNPELGGVDCIRDGRGNPDHRPRPTPRPIPGPGPIPRPVPRPQPGPGYGTIDASALIIDLQKNVFEHESKTKMMNQLIQQIGGRSLAPFPGLCGQSRTWYDNMLCLLNAIERAPRELVHEQNAIPAVGMACRLTLSWFDERKCFDSAFKQDRFASLNYYAQSCSKMFEHEGAARCYRQVFGAQ